MRDDASISVIAKATSTNFSVRRSRSERTSWSGPVSTAWLGTGTTRLLRKWMRSPSRDCIASKSETAMGIPTRLFSRSGTARSRPAADRQTKAISRADANGDPCRGTRDTEEQEEDRVEADHRSARSVSPGRYREARMVCVEVENRGVPQDPQIGLQS